MNPVSSRPQAWTPQALSDLRKAIDGDGLFRPAPAAPPVSHFRDVMIMAPQGGGLFQSTPVDLAVSLKDHGVEVHQSVQEVGCAARVSAEKAADLKEKGFQLVDDSPRNLLPSMPSFPTRHWEIRAVDPVEMTGAARLHEAGYTGKGEIVAILDSGADCPELSSRILKYSDFAENLQHFRDGAGHGSHVLQDAHATAPDACFVVGRVMGDDGAGRPSDILRGLKWVEGLKNEGLNITVVNLSMGGVPDGLPENLDVIDRQIDKLAAMGIKIVAAAGNEGAGEHTIGSPGDAFGAITVGAALDSGKVSDFSSRGPTDDGLEKPDFVAPGEFIGATVPAYSEMYRTASSIQKLRDMDGEGLRAFLTERPQVMEAFGLPSELLGQTAAEVEQQLKSQLPPTGLTQDGKVISPGTSFSAPLTAGIIACLESYKHQTVDECRELLKSSADPIAGYSRIEQGSGFINAEKAFLQLQHVA